MASLVMLGVSLLALLVGLYLVREDYLRSSKSNVVVETRPELRSVQYIHYLDAETANRISQDTASEEVVYEILKPVLELVKKESRNGNFSAYVHGMDWYYGTNIKYSKAISKLKEMGYRTEYRSSATGITIRWD